MLPDSGNSLHTVHTSCQLTLQHHNSYNRTDNYRQWNAVGSDDGHKDAWNMLKYYWLPINHYLLHLVGLTFTHLSKMLGHLNIKYVFWFLSLQFCLIYFSFWEEFGKILSYLYTDFHIKCRLFLSDFHQTWIFPTGFRKIKYQIWCKSVRWEPTCPMRTQEWRI